MIKVTSKLAHALSVPLRPELGINSPIVTIPAATPAGPGTLETDQLDAVTIARLTHIYGRRPNDGDTENASENDGTGHSRYLEIGLLTFTKLDGSPLGKKPEDEGKSGKRAA